ncbi:MAG: LysR family transcriptional regulator [Synechococcaceae cyanobacterium RM1_1_27]|nr:LysR family transcriptional regulator [Synechococcaceae cyanobacterium RM1_1_27]
MNLKTLRAFIVLAEELHFGRAAEKCKISQPAMSRLLSELESDLEVRLLKRTSRDVSLTQAGRAFLESVRKSVAYADMAVRAAKTGAIDGIDSLTIGMVIGTQQPLMGKIIARFKRTHPETRVFLRQLDERSIGSALADGSIDVAVAWDAAIPAGLNHHPLEAVPLRVLVNSGHPLEEKDPLRFTDLAGYPIILPDREQQPVIYDTYLRYTAEAGFEPLIAIDVSTLSDMLAMVAGGVGVGLAPIVPGLFYPGVSILSQDPVFERSYELVWAEKLPAVESLLNCYLDM